MKKTSIFFAASASIFLLIFSACVIPVSGTSSSGSSSSGSGSSSTPTITTATASETAAYDGKPLIVDVGSTIKSLTITGTSSAAGKGVYLAKVNNSTAYEITYSALRYVSSVSGITKATGAAKYDLSDAGSSAAYSSKGFVDKYGTGCLTPYLNDFMSKKIMPDTSAEKNSLMQMDSRTAVTYEVGSKKTMHLMFYTDSSGRQTSLNVECEVVAADSNSKILIWAPAGSSDYNLSDSETTFKSDTAVSFSEDSKLNNKTWKDYYINYFKDIYNLDRTVFGDEAEVTGSDTSGYMNLVFFNMDKYVTMGIRGYFYGIDYYPASTYANSNVGKYLYINVNPAVSTTRTSTTSSGTSLLDTYEMITATMAHEFMHMIQFNQKYLKQNITCTTAFGEMMGEIAKDLIVDYMNPQRAESVWNRMTTFNQAYTYAGMTGYSDYSIYYSTNYVFGAWLCRNFGGAKLAREFIQNEYNSDNAIVQAVNKINGTSYTISDLIKLFTAAITISNSDYEYPLNKAAAAQSEIVCPASMLTSGEAYAFPLLPINIYNLPSTLKFSELGISTTSEFANGPLLYNAYSYLPKLGNINSEITKNGTLAGYHGIHLCKIGTIAEGSSEITIDFSSYGSSLLQMYVIIGDNRAAKGE